MNKKVNDDLKNIKIYDIPGFFTNERIRRILVFCDITTLEDFFYAIENSSLITMLEPSSTMLKEILATFKLLRCKYLGEDPNITINDSMSTEQIIKELGLSFETGYELMRMKKAEDLYQKLSKMSIEEKILYFKRNSNMSELALKEIAYKLQILDDYNNLKIISSIKNEIDEKSNNEDRKDILEKKTNYKSKKEKNKKERKSRKKVESEEEILARLRETVNLLPRARGK